MAKKDQAVNFANQLDNVMGVLRALRPQINDLVTTFNSEGYGTIWDNFATAAQNADGALGTADGTPNTAHPFDLRVAGQTLLQRAVSSTQQKAGVTLLQQLQNFFTNAAVVTGNYNQTLDDLAG